MVTKVYGDTGVDKIVDGTITSSDLASGVGGKVLQVVQSQIATTQSTTSTSYVTSNLSASITPSSTSSKILCIWTIQVKFGAGERGIGTKLLRGSATAYVSGTTYDVYAGADNDRQRPYWTVLDSPSTTSAVVYKVQVATYNTNVTVNDAGNSSQITLMEIQG